MAESRPSLAARARAWFAALTLRDAVVLTAVPVAAVLLVLADATLRFSRAIQFDDWWSARASVAGMFSDRVHAIASLPERVALRQGFDADASDPSLIRLEVPGTDWTAMHGDALVGWGEWVGGTLRYGATALDVRLRKRGDNSIHWMTDKRTMTVRTQRDDLYKRYRSFALSVKDVVPSYLANGLAAHLGVLAPTTEVVPVFVNNQFYGLFRFIETVDESLLRPFDRMPGNIFRGDAAERGDYFKGVPRNLFDNPYLWDRVAMNDRWTSAGPGQLAQLLADLRGGTFADHQRLMARLDLEALRRLLAYLLIVGDPYHMDRIHNQFVYEDPSTQQLAFIPWDIRLQDLRRPNGTVNDLLQAALRDPRLTDAIVAEVHRIATTGEATRVADSMMRRISERYGRYLRYDQRRTGLVPSVGDPNDAGRLIRANLAELERWAGLDTVAVAVAQSATLSVVDLETRGMIGADLVGFDRPWPSGARLYADTDRDGRWTPNDRAVTWTPDSAGRPRLRRSEPLFAAWSTAGPGIGSGSMPYRLFVVGAVAGQPTLTNRVSGRAPATVPWEVGAVVRQPTGWHPWAYPESPGRLHRLSGAVTLDTTWRLAAADTLLIEPGTTLRLAPDVSIVSRGLVRAVGTAARPIRVVPADTARPWGAFALLGHGTDSSVIRHVEFIRGGGALVDRIEYIGMVNVHRARGVVVDSVAFIENLRSDDTFHALHADVSVTNSRFVRANSDALDMDISTGVLRGNVFRGSGGDAIDLMTSHPVVIDNDIEAAGDKGISIGEASAPFVFNNRIANGVNGIEIKDRSAPVILSNDVRGVNVGLRVRMKNWRYGGSGFGLIANSRFAATEPLSVDSAARLTVEGVAGLDSTTGSAADLPWLYAAHGIAAPAVIGAVDRWRPIAVRPPLGRVTFEDDFADVTGGWRAGRAVTRLEKRRDVLVIEVEGQAGSIERGVDWDATAAGGVVVFEVAGRDVRGGRLVAETADGRVWSADLGALTKLDRYRLIPVAVPSSRVVRLSVEVEPTPGLSHLQRETGLSVLRGARVDLRRVTLYPAVVP